MVRFCVLILALFGFSVIAAEMFNSFELLETRINVLIIAIPMTLSYAVSQLILGYYEKKAKNSINHERRYQILKKYYFFIFGLIGFFTLIIVPLVWWGAIEQLANLAGDGYRKF